MEKWYANNYRRHLLDMHIDDWNEKFLSEFDEYAYLENLKKAHIQCAMIYLQSHIGLCNFPTKVCREHNAFVKNQKIINLVNLCRENGIKVVGYYSLIHNNWAEENYPEWRMIKENGRSAVEDGGRYGFVCLNNADYRKFLTEQIKEMSEYFKLDGLFYDMPFWPVACRCDSCKKRWEKEVGGEFPKEDFKDEKFRTYIRKLQNWMGEFCAFVVGETKKYFKDATIEFNNAGVIAFGYDAGSTEQISDLADYVGGDLYGDLFNHSFSCKYYYTVTNNQPFEYMNTRCPVLQQHTVNKSDERLKTEIALTRAHHGATFIIDAIDPIGTMDSRVYDKVGRIFEEQIPLEKYNKGELVADVAVFYDSSAQFSANGYEFNNKWCSKSAVKNLTRNHIPTAVIANGHLGDLSKYKCVVLSAIEDFDNPEIEKFIKYVEDGGKLYFSSVSDKRLIGRLLGGKITGFTHGDFSYVAPTEKGKPLFEYFNEKYPLPLGYKLPILESDENFDTLATITLPYFDPNDERKFASIHSNPPGEPTAYPALVRKKVGKGEVIWSAGAIEHEEDEIYGKIFANILSVLTNNDYKFKANASKNVEVVEFMDDENAYINVVSLSGDFDCSYDCELKVKVDGAPEKVVDLQSGEQVGFKYSDGYCEFNCTLKRFRSFLIKK